EFVAVAECDAQYVDLASVDEAPSPASSPDADAAHAGTNDAHAARAGANGAHVDAKRARASTKKIRVRRAKQSIPPAVRRAVLRRDRHRCRAPGCRNHSFVDVHHVRISSEGGSVLPSNLVTLCSAHHD